VIKTEQCDAIAKYQENCSKSSDTERDSTDRKKTGVFSGLFCKNHLTGYMMPLYIRFCPHGIWNRAVVSPRTRYKD
jgi:leucyl-tRNA synthetase